MSASRPLLKKPQANECPTDTFDHETPSCPASLESTGWTPFYLRTWVLACFLLLFLVMIAALQVLLSISESRRGIATSRDDLYYL